MTVSARRRWRRNGAAVVLVVAAGVVAFVGSAAARSHGSTTRPGLGALPAGSGLVLSFAFDPAAPGTVYLGTLGMTYHGHVYKTTDAGLHWRSTEHTDPGWTRVDAITTDPRHPGTLYAGTGAAVYKTVNGGRSWRAWSRGLLPPPPVLATNQVTGTPGWRSSEGWVTALAVDPRDSHIVYAGTGGGVKKSTDGGHSWSTVLWRGRYMGISAVVIAPKGRQVVYAAASTDQPASCGLPGTTRCHQTYLVYRSADGGKTWRPTGLRRANPKANFSALVLDPQHSTTLYAAIGSDVLRTTDAGRSWRPITHGLSGESVNSLAVDPQRSGAIYAASSGGIFKTTNGGLIWSRTSPGFPVYGLAVDPAHPTTIYAGVGQPTRIIRSTDGGRTWATP